MTETVFEVLAEGGSLKIQRQLNGHSVKFIYHNQEFDPLEEGMEIHKIHEYESFEQPFQLINFRFPWFKLHLQTVHEDYKAYVTEELIKKLNTQNITPENLGFSQKSLEETLNLQLKYDFLPDNNGLLNIHVSNLMKLTEYEYQEFVGESEIPARIRGKYEIWTDEQIYSSKYNEIIRQKYEFKTIGKLEISGNTVIIKNEWDQIQYVFSSEKFFLSTTPILSKTPTWFYLKS